MAVADNSYIVTGAGTFVPAETVTEYSIDTGIPFSNILSGVRQELIIWSDPATRYGWIIGSLNALLSSRVGAVVGYNTTYSSKVLGSSDGSKLPNIGETIWTITGLSNSTNFRAGIVYHWIVMEKTL